MNPSFTSPSLPEQFVTRFSADYPNIAARVLAAMNETPSPALNLNARKHAPLPETVGRVDWNLNGFYLPSGFSPVFDPTWHAGGYYMMEAASQSVAHVLSALALPPNLRALDLCAAPGGKSSVLLNALPDDAVVVSNEIIRSRANILYENAVKWGCDNHVVSHSDPQALAATGITFDLILVDAPCSGEGMFRKDVNARTEWSIDNVNQCALRQRDILTAATEMMAQAGYLIYSTCTFADDENDAQIHTLLASGLWQLVPIDFSAVSSENRPLATRYGWQFLPGITRSEGLYICALQFIGQPTVQRRKIVPHFHPFKGSIPFQSPFEAAAETLVTEGQRVWHMHPAVQAVTNHLRSFKTPLLKAGIAVGSVKGKDVLPDHELALWNAMPTTGGLEMDVPEALAYLRGHSQRGNYPKGWHVVLHEGHALGWLKSVGDRWNNAYPQHWKLRS
jgi:16S rRNA C967 or C1407 C5-methylase (RsmB/RsmF family)/NOL1/NOP2/fmu family ribosome biogenesis protein